MQSFKVVEVLGYLEPLGCVVTLLLIHYRGQLSRYKPLVLFLATRVISFAFLMPLQTQTISHRLEKHLAYKCYFYGYWASYAIEACLGFFIIFKIYNLAMEPLPGLQRLGILMFRWAGGIALAIAVTVAVGPHVTSNSFIVRSVTQLDQTQSILTLCMLLFVCLASRPMGLTYRSKIFGVCLGLGLMAMAELVCAAWFAHYPKSMYSSISIFKDVATCVALLIWSAYFAVPEPKRRMIVLPTTSPFLRWNQISLALGDEPGFVAIGAVTPDMFAPAEVEVMRRASAKMQMGTAKMQLPVAN